MSIIVPTSHVRAYAVLGIVRLPNAPTPTGIRVGLCVFASSDEEAKWAYTQEILENSNDALRTARRKLRALGQPGPRKATARDVLVVEVQRRPQWETEAANLVAVALADAARR